MAFLYAFALFELVVLVITVWAYYCVNQTHVDRCAIIDRLALQDYKLESLEASERFWQAFYAVGYNLHVWYRMTFRDPHQLYVNELRPQ